MRERQAVGTLRVPRVPADGDEGAARGDGGSGVGSYKDAAHGAASPAMDANLRMMTGLQDRLRSNE
jgi:hypothetical protein